jgi:hypothetical protein
MNSFQAFSHSRSGVTGTVIQHGLASEVPLARPVR